MIETIKEHIQDISTEEVPENIDFYIEELLDRLRLYLNRDNIEELKLEKIVAKIISKQINEITAPGDERAISSVSDNGQSISYFNEPLRRFLSVTDDELFEGYTSLLNRYRRLNI